MKRIYILRYLIVALFLLLVQAETVVGQFTDFEVNRTEIVPGFIKLQIINDELPLHVVALEIDISVPENDIRTVLAHNKLGTGFEHVDSMAIRNQSGKEKVIGAINADFFHIRTPDRPDQFLVNSMVSNSKPVYTGNPVRSRSNTHFGIEKNKKLFIGAVGFDGFLIVNDHTEFSISGLNVELIDDKIAVYNHYFSESTQSIPGDSKWLLIPEENGSFADTLKATIRTIEPDENIEFSDRNLVLASKEDVSDELNQVLMDGEEIDIFLGLRPAASGEKRNFSGFRELTGGGPHLLYNGEHATDNFIDFEGFPESFSDRRHNRSAVGINRDSTKVILAAIDGRQPEFSVGATLAETADIMKVLGSWNAVNLDGGGSTTLVIEDEMINRHNEDGNKKRRVANALLGIIHLLSDE